MRASNHSNPTPSQPGQVLGWVGARSGAPWGIEVSAIATILAGGYALDMPAFSAARVQRGLYSLAMRLGLPLLLYHMVWRGLRYPEYFRRWDERLGVFTPLPVKPRIWLHAVSVGEVNAAAPLVEALQQRYPDHALLVTTITPTGSERARTLWGGDIEHVYLPWDLPGAVDRFFDASRPDVGLIMETEIWPNLYFGARARGIPMLITNARLSARSLRGYAPLRALIKRALSGVSVAAQSKLDADRLIELGADPARVQVAGNLKYHLRIAEGLPEAAAAWRATWGTQRPVWLAASTHSDEEPQVLSVHQALLRHHPDALVLWAPRHPERFEAVIDASRDAGLRTATRRIDALPSAGTQCFVIDTLGELLQFLPAVDACFVGGSLQAIGGHNVLEPAALGVPVLVGPHTFNFVEATRILDEAGALVRVRDAQALARELLSLLEDPGRRDAMGQAGRQLVERQRGALERVMAVIEQVYRPDRRHDADAILQRKRGH